jgi:hypothetical protein
MGLDGDAASVPRAHTDPGGGKPLICLPDRAHCGWAHERSARFPRGRMYIFVPRGKE